MSPSPKTHDKSSDYISTLEKKRREHVVCRPTCQGSKIHYANHLGKPIQPAHLVCLSAWTRIRRNSSSCTTQAILLLHRNNLHWWHITQRRWRSRGCWKQPPFFLLGTANDSQEILRLWLKYQFSKHTRAYCEISIIWSFPKKCGFCLWEVNSSSPAWLHLPVGAPGINTALHLPFSDGFQPVFL